MDNTNQLFPADLGRGYRLNNTNSETKHLLEKARARLLLVCMIFTLGCMAVTFKLTDAMLFHSNGDTGLPKAIYSSSNTTTRADITDRNGELFATSIVMASAYVDTQLILDPNEAITKLSKVLPNLNKKALAEKIQSGRRFVWLKRNLTPREHAAIHKLGIPGIGFQREEKRIYPNKELASHIVGFTGIDNNGLAGLERYFDQQLRTSGHSLKTSLDLRLQHMMRDSLITAIKKFKAVGGTGIIMDANSGEVLSLVSLPDFDPNRLDKSSKEALFNKATLGVYEMGSTFKIFNTALALDSGIVRMKDSFDATRPIQIGKYTISDFHPENRWLTVPEIFMHSSNIGSVRMALRVGTEKQKKFMTKLGLIQKPAFELHEIGHPQFPNPWREINTMTIAYGHGMAVSPLQIVAATASIVNGGHLIRPTILPKDINSGLKKDNDRIISDKTSEQIRNLMRLVVTDGTAKSADVPGYRVGGKTGTAEKISGSGYNQKSMLSSFIGVFPIDKPEYIVFVAIDEPKGISSTYGFATGGWTAAPVVGSIISQAAPLLGVLPEVDDIPETRTAHSSDSKTITNFVSYRSANDSQ